MADLSSTRGSRTDSLNPSRGLRWVWLFWLALPVLAYLGLRTISLEEVWRAIARLQGWQAAVLIAANLGVLVLMAGRWWAILRAFGWRVSLVKLLGYRLAGFGLSYYTPGPQFGGEPLQVLLLHRAMGVPTTTAVTSVFFDKLIELLANFTFLVLGLAAALAAGLLHGGFSSGLWLVIPAVMAWPALHLRALATGRRPLTWLLERFEHRWRRPIWEVAARHAREGEEMMGRLLREQPRALAAILAISALVWVVSVAEFTLLLHFLGAPVNLVQSIAILTAARVAFLLPVPGGLGVLEASLYLAIQAAGFDPGLGLAASLIIRARDMSLGAIGLIIGGIQSRDQPAWSERRTEAWNE